MILGAFYRIMTPILSLASGLLGYSLALTSDREAATTYVFSAALVSVIMLTSHVFISKYKQVIQDLEDDEIKGISLSYSKKILLYTFIVFIVAFIVDYQLLSIMLFSVPISCGYLLVSFKAQIYRNDLFWRVQFVGSIFRAIILVLMHFLFSINFLELSIVSVLVHGVIYVQYNGLNMASKYKEKISISYRDFLDGLARALRADHEYHILVVLGVFQTKVFPESSYTITLPYLNSGRIAIRSFLNKWDTKRLPNIISIVLVTFAICMHFIVMKYNSYVLDISLLIFKSDLRETIIFGLIILAASVWTSGSLLLEILPVDTIYSYYFASLSICLLSMFLGSIGIISIELLFIIYYYFIGVVLNWIHGKIRAENI